MLHIYTGSGKGKTTAAVGQIVRSLGHERKVCLLQLFKPENFYGEQKILRKMKNLKIYSFAHQHPFCDSHNKRTFVRGEHLFGQTFAKNECEKALNCLHRILKQKKYNLIVLDEFNIAVRDGFMNIDKLLKILEKAKQKITIVITGRAADKKLLAIADLVTEFKEIKHPFRNGIKAAKGIEY